MPISTNEILYRIQKALNLTRDEILECYKLVEFNIDTKHLESLLVRHQEKDFMLCTYEELGVFLDGLVTFKRGPSTKEKNKDEVVELTNNLILKKLHIAMELKVAETEIIFGLAEIELTKQQLASLFRKESHKNFKSCSDELLMSFLEGLDEFYYSGEEV